MRLRIDTSNVRFRVAGLARPRTESKDSQVQKKTPDGRPIWNVRLNAFDMTSSSTETIFVEVAGDQPDLVPDEVATVEGLTYTPWVNRKGELVRAFRADVISMGKGAERRAA
jgi:hypothetical protein